MSWALKTSHKKKLGLTSWAATRLDGDRDRPSTAPTRSVRASSVSRSNADSPSVPAGRTPCGVRTSAQPDVGQGQIC